jgi:predicted DNA-binding transcriptional regulator AlpA
MIRPPLIAAHERLGLSREEAAQYIGVGHSLFDAMVADGRMPRPKVINARRIWARPAIEKAFALLPEDEHDEDDGSPWRTPPGP